MFNFYTIFTQFKSLNIKNLKRFPQLNCVLIIITGGKNEIYY